MARIVTFGELMLRLSPEGYLRFLQADRFGVTFGGAEANVAAGLAILGMDAAFVTKLPKHEIGQAALNSLRRYGVDTSLIARGGARVGIYFAEKGASQRPSKVIYDRADSAIAAASFADFNWDNILGGADWFHWTGITPALGEGVTAILEQALKVCKQKKISVSCDLNYRKNLWSKDKAREVMTKLAPYIDVCIANEEDADDVFGVKAADTDITGGKLSRSGYEFVAEQLAAKFGFGKVAITLRGSVSANDNSWAGLLYDGTRCVFSKEYNIHIVDRVGGGDSFGAGLIYAFLNQFDCQKAIEFAAAASCLKQTIEGDYDLVSVDEINKLMQGDGSGRVVR